MKSFLAISFSVMLVWPAMALAVAGDEATHESDHLEDVLELPEVHVHGLPLNKDQQFGPVPKATPWPAIPPGLDGKELDDWMKARMMVSKDAKVTVVVLEPAKHRCSLAPAQVPPLLKSELTTKDASASA